MPTVILLDVSLSMLRPIPTSDTAEPTTRLTLACTAINTFLDFLNANNKLEYVSLVTFSSNYDIAVPFTRDFDVIRKQLMHLEEGDKTCLEVALAGVNQLVLTEWGHQTMVQVILVTDGTAGVGPMGLARITQSLPLPPNYPLRMHILPICTPQQNSLRHAMPLYQTLVNLCDSAATSGDCPNPGVYCPEQLTPQAVTVAASKLAEQQYTPCSLQLCCGALECRVTLHPACARGVTSANVIGFISSAHAGTPITVSRHIMMPQANVAPASSRDNYDKVQNKENPDIMVVDEETDPSKVPNFCVLLHGALKIEGMVALVHLGSGYGCVSAWCETGRARRSCLLLSVLAPNAAPWLGSLELLGCEDDGVEPLPIRASRSYSAGAGNCGSAWTRSHALLADAHKVLRHARKLPDKTPHLYKELNRIRRVAISLGFSELLLSLSAALERECTSSSTPESASQLAHAAASLRESRCLDITHQLTPLQQSYAH